MLRAPPRKRKVVCQDTALMTQNAVDGAMGTPTPTLVSSRHGALLNNNTDGPDATTTTTTTKALLLRNNAGNNNANKPQPPSASSSSNNNARPAPFLQKLVKFLEECPPDTGGFAADGASFSVHDAKAGPRLKNYFAHSNLKSLNRQLSAYGFTKQRRKKFGADDHWSIWSHESFHRDKPHLLPRIKRMDHLKNDLPPSISHTQSASSGAPDIISAAVSQKATTDSASNPGGRATRCDSSDSAVDAVDNASRASSASHATESSSSSSEDSSVSLDQQEQQLSHQKPSVLCQQQQNNKDQQQREPASSSSSSSSSSGGEEQQQQHQQQIASRGLDGLAALGVAAVTLSGGERPAKRSKSNAEATTPFFLSRPARVSPDERPSYAQLAHRVAKLEAAVEALLRGGSSFRSGGGIGNNTTSGGLPRGALVVAGGSLVSEGSSSGADD